MAHSRYETPARARVLAALLAGLMLLTACSTPGPAPMPESPTAPPSSSGPSASPSAHPPSRSVTPASGPKLTRRTLWLRAPADYVLDPPHAGYSGAGPADSCAGVTVYESPARRVSVAQLVRYASENPAWTKRPTREPDTRIAGRAAYHLHGETRWSARFPHIDTHEYGRFVGRTWVSLQFSFDTAPECVASAEYRQDIIDSVLATVHWR